MNDNEIITIDIAKYAEALNRLIGADSAYFSGDKDVDAIVEVITLAKKMENIINRQKADIERLEKENSEGFKKYLLLDKRTKERYAELYEEAKDVVRTEAIKEFAERLKKLTYPFPCAIGAEYAVTIRAIDDLVKEMTEEKK